MRKLLDTPFVINLIEESCTENLYTKKKKRTKHRDFEVQ